MKCLSTLVVALLWSWTATAGTSELERPRPAGAVPMGHVEWMHAAFAGPLEDDVSPASGAFDLLTTFRHAHDRHWEVETSVVRLVYDDADRTGGVRLGNVTVARETRRPDGDYTRWSLTVPTPGKDDDDLAVAYGVSSDWGRPERFVPGAWGVELVEGRRREGRLGVLHLAFAPKILRTRDDGEILIRYALGWSSRGPVTASAMVTGWLKGLMASAMNQPDKHYQMLSLGLQAPLGGMRGGVFLGLPLDESMEGWYDRTLAVRLTID
ncbi:MAG TPA: hypothetical protein PLH84_05025 [Candidatus Krumholzibacteria bacterium]|nr:hypothetical protein [Candidatus Krumholzibacteria bacterium]